MKESTLKTEMKKMRKDNDEKKDIIRHLLHQLNLAKGGQDYELWMAERKEKNKIIGQLMQHIAALEKNPDDRADLQAQIQILKCRVTKLKIEKDELTKQYSEAVQQNIRSLREDVLDEPIPKTKKAASSKSHRELADSSSSKDRKFRVVANADTTRRKTMTAYEDSDATSSKTGTSDHESVAVSDNDTYVTIFTPNVSRPPIKIWNCPDGFTGLNSGPPISVKYTNMLSSARSVLSDSVTIPSPIVTPSSPLVLLRRAPPLSPKMSVRKPLNWATIAPHKVNNTIWAKASQGSVSIDPASLEKLFVNCIASPQTSQLSPINLTKSNIIDFARANGIVSMLSGFKGGVAEIKAAIVDLNESILTQDNTSRLLQFIPTKEEMQLISEFGELASLGKADYYFKEISEVPRVEQRLKVHLFSLKYPELVEEIRPDLKSVHQAAAAAKESKRLCRILEIVLAVGNFLNVNTPKGNAFGFRLDSLKQLKDMKGNDGTSLLHYIAELISFKYTDLWDWEAELCHLEHAAKVSWNSINEVMKTISRGVQLVAKEMVLANDPQDKFSGLLASLSALCAGEYDELVKAVKEAETAMIDVTQYYGEPTPASGLAPSPDIIFAPLVSFLEDLANARKEQQRRAVQQGSPSCDSSSSSLQQGREKGGVEDVTATIRKGHIFKERRKTPNSIQISLRPGHLARASKSYNTVADYPGSPSPPPPSSSPLSFIKRSWIKR